GAVGGGGDGGTNRGRRWAQLAAVGGAVASLAVVRILREADHAEVLGEEIGHRRVRLQRVVNDRLGRHLGPAAGRRGGAFGAGREPPEQLLAVVLGERAQGEIRARVFGDDVRLIAALYDGGRHARVGPELRGQL